MINTHTFFCPISVKSFGWSTRFIWPKQRAWPRLQIGKRAASAWFCPPSRPKMFPSSFPRASKQLKFPRERVIYVLPHSPKEAQVYFHIRLYYKNYNYQQIMHNKVYAYNRISAGRRF